MKNKKNMRQRVRQAAQLRSSGVVIVGFVYRGQLFFIVTFMKHHLPIQGEAREALASDGKFKGILTNISNEDKSVCNAIF
jgi:hypothetical protein